MNGSYGRSFLTVTAIHVGLVLLLIVSGTITSCRRRKDVMTYLPVQFVTEIPKPAILEPPAPDPPSEPPPRKIPEPAKKKIPVPEKKKEPAPPPKRVERKTDITVKPRPLTREQVEQMLNLPAQDRPAQPVAPIANDAMYDALIRQTFYDAWNNQPSYSDVGGSVATAEVGLDPDGLITSRKLISRSGNAVLDNSVLQLINSVRRIPGLSEDFIRRHRTVRVSFRVEE